MKKYKDLTEFLTDLEPEKRAQVELLRSIVLDLGPEVQESFKWNAPNYNYKNIDRITFNLMNKEGKVKVVIHMGTTIKEDKKAKPVLETAYDYVIWNSNIRATITFENLDHIDSQKEAVSSLLTQWLKLEVPSSPTNLK